MAPLAATNLTTGDLFAAVMDLVSGTATHRIRPLSLGR